MNKTLKSLHRVLKSLRLLETSCYHCGARSVRPRVGPTPEESRADTLPRQISGAELDPEATALPETAEGSEVGTGSVLDQSPVAHETLTYGLSGTCVLGRTSSITQ